MALVNVHPDYMRFDGQAARSQTFPADFYSRLLQHVREKHGQTVWQARPKDVAAFVVSVPRETVLVTTPEQLLLRANPFAEARTCGRGTRYLTA